MPSQLSLILYVIFIIVVFIIDSKRQSEFSYAIWIPLLWLIIVGSRPVALWVNPGAIRVSSEGLLEGSPHDRAFYLILTVIGILILSRRKIEWTQILQNNRWLLLLFLFGMISILWSNYPFVAFKRWTKAVGNLIMVLVVLTDPNPVEALKTLFRRWSYVLIPLSIVLIKYYRHLGVTYNYWTGNEMLAGVTTDKNALGRLCLVGGLFFFWEIVAIWHNKVVFIDKKKVVVYVFMLLMTLWLLIKAGSATSLLCLIVGVFVLISLGVPIISRNLKYIGIYAFFTVFGFLILQFLFDINKIILLNLGRDETLTERTDIWKMLLNIGTNPWVGSGYESFWLGDNLTKIWTKWLINESHNGYLEIYLTQGLIGLLLLMIVIVVAYRNCKRELFFNFDFGKFKMALLIVCLLYNITEAGFRGIDLIWFIFLLITIDIHSVLQMQNYRRGNNA